MLSELVGEGKGIAVSQAVGGFLDGVVCKETAGFLDAHTDAVFRGGDADEAPEIFAEGGIGDMQLPGEVGEVETVGEIAFEAASGGGDDLVPEAFAGPLEGAFIKGGEEKGEAADEDAATDVPVGSGAGFAQAEKVLQSEAGCTGGEDFVFRNDVKQFEAAVGFHVENHKNFGGVGGGVDLDAGFGAGQVVVEGAGEDWMAAAGAVGELTTTTEEEVKGKKLLAVPAGSVGVIPMAASAEDEDAPGGAGA